MTIDAEDTPEPILIEKSSVLDMNDAKILCKQDTVDTPSSEEKLEGEKEDEGIANEPAVEYFSDDSATEKTKDLQRHRLLQLRHAIKCPYEINKCPISSHCGKLKTLWKHLLQCKDQYCDVPLCVSSRYIIYHYGSCPKDNCNVCRPVRDTYKRAHTEEEERRLLQRVPPKRMRVSRSQTNFVIQGLKRNSFDEEREVRTRIVKDADSPSFSSSGSPFLGPLKACSLSSETSVPVSGSPSGKQLLATESTTSTNVTTK